MINRSLPFGWIGLALALLLQNATAAELPLTIAVAANVKPAFDELVSEFRKQTGIAAQGVFGATGTLAAQVLNGAPFDVFLSADTETPDVLYKRGVAATTPRIYVYGVLVLWTRRPDLDIGKGVAMLNDVSVQKIAIANPALAPYGRAALQALERTGLRKAIEPKVVYGESIGQALQFADSGAADVALGALSLAVAPGLAERGRWEKVPKDVYDPIAQAVVVLKHGGQTQPDAAGKFEGFLFTPVARAIFAKYGYVAP